MTTVEYVLPDGTILDPETARAYAEERLGRPLTDGEKALDLVGLDVDLRDGKERLVAAIEDEKRRVEEEALRGRPGVLRVTPDMRAAMDALIESGRQHATREIATLTGLDPEAIRATRAHAEGESILDRLLRTIASALTSIRVRIAGEMDAAEFRNQEITEQLLERLDRRVPGARDLASRVSSSLMFGGLGEIYEQNADLFPCFTYSAVMDSATCHVCREFDGRRYDTWVDGEVDLPNGGPNPLCLGDGRCRCRLVPCPPGDVVPPEPPPVPTPEPPPEPVVPPPAPAPPPPGTPPPEPGFERRVADGEFGWRARYAWAPREHGISMEEYEQRVADRLRTETADHEVRIRARPDVVLAILEQGRFKSQFETSTSGGMLDPHVRAAAERKFFSYPREGFPPEQRPIYGYIAPPDASEPGYGYLEMYGSFVFRMKREVRARATVTFTDSLGAADEESFRPSPLDDPSPHSVRPERGDPLVAPLRDFGVYHEAQIHGGVTLDDVAEIFIAGNAHLFPEIVAAADRAGVPWRALDTSSAER